MSAIRRVVFGHRDQRRRATHSPRYASPGLGRRSPGDRIPRPRRFQKRRVPFGSVRLPPTPHPTRSGSRSFSTGDFRLPPPPYRPSRPNGVPPAEDPLPPPLTAYRTPFPPTHVPSRCRQWARAEGEGVLIFSGGGGDGSGAGMALARLGGAAGRTDAFSPNSVGVATASGRRVRYLGPRRRRRRYSGGSACARKVRDTPGERRPTDTIPGKRLWKRVSIRRTRHPAYGSPPIRNSVPENLHHDRAKFNGPLTAYYLFV